PFPQPSFDDLNDPIMSKTINDNPHLFKIVTPIKVDVLREYLSEHPNQAFVESILHGLSYGFHPWPDYHKPNYPSIVDESRPFPDDPLRAEFLRDQCKIEIEKGRFSESFGPDLLPGMYSMPVHAVPKPNSDDFRMVTDHSAGRHSLNSMINHDEVTGFPLDNLHHMGEML
ncbi:hypothetical protein CPC08DRAFT_622554, partial [Agrocybe pediades]